MKTALIFGASGQDGAYMSKLLLKRGYRVVGASRDAQVQSFGNLRLLNVYDDVEKRSVNLEDLRSLLECLERVKPEEIYNFSGQSSVGLSFEQPKETFDSILTATLNLLEAVRFVKLPTRIYNSCSGECFGEVAKPADETTPFNPRSPYGVAKAAAHWAVTTYRDGFGIHAFSGFLFNHESPLRPERFVTQKVIKTACRIAAGSKERLELGNIEIKRDWGWAPEFVEGIYRMMQLSKPEDFVLATGKNHSLQEFVEMTFKQLELHWRDHVVLKSDFVRPSEIRQNAGNAGKAETLLGWKPQVTFEEIISRMIRAAQDGYKNLE